MSQLPAPGHPSALPIRPLLTSRLPRSLLWSVTWHYPVEDETALPYPVLAPNWEPPPLDADALGEAAAQVERLRGYLAPVTDMQWLGDRVQAWVVQSWLHELEPGPMRMIVSDWIEGLREFPKWALAKVAAQTVRGDHRCSLAVVFKACTLEVADARVELAGLERLVDPRQQERARRRVEEERRAEERRA